MRGMKQKHVRGEVKIRGFRGVIWMRRSALSLLLSSVASWLLVISLTALGIPIVPLVWYRIAPETPRLLEEVLARPVVTEFPDTVITPEEAPAWQPPLDTTLGAENRVEIDSIGVTTKIIEKPKDQYEDAFREGVWRVPDFGDAYTRERPMILVAHRFGYLAWTNQYRRENSFFNLPKLEPGDMVRVIWEQREYTYEIYAGEEGTEISDYEADLILYTCKFLESDVRIFRYARLVTDDI